MDPDEAAPANVFSSKGHPDSFPVLEEARQGPRACGPEAGRGHDHKAPVLTDGEEPAEDLALPDRLHQEPLSLELL